MSLLDTQNPERGRCAAYLEASFRDPERKARIRQFATTCFINESVEFLIAVQNFKSILDQCVQDIWSTFISPSAQTPINVSYGVSNKIKVAIDGKGAEISRSMFDQAQDHIVALIQFFIAQSQDFKEWDPNKPETPKRNEFSPQRSRQKSDSKSSSQQTVNAPHSTSKKQRRGSFGRKSRNSVVVPREREKRSFDDSHIDYSDFKGGTTNSGRERSFSSSKETHLPTFKRGSGENPTSGSNKRANESKSSKYSGTSVGSPPSERSVYRELLGSNAGFNDSAAECPNWFLGASDDVHLAFTNNSTAPSRSPTPAKPSSARSIIKQEPKTPSIKDDAEYIDRVMDKLNIGYVHGPDTSNSAGTKSLEHHGKAVFDPSMVDDHTYTATGLKIGTAKFDLEDLGDAGNDFMFTQTRKI